MIELILILIFSLIIIFSLILGVIISYHFKRFTVIGTVETKKFLTIFAIGITSFLILSLFFLILTI